MTLNELITALQFLVTQDHGELDVVNDQDEAFFSAEYNDALDQAVIVLNFG